MSPEIFVDVLRDALFLVILLVSAIILPSLFVGLLVAIFQAATSINEQTLSFLPRLIVTLLALIYGGFSYTKDTTAVKLGPLELSVKEKERVNVPMWAGIAARVAGGLMLVVGSKRS